MKKIFMNIHKRPVNITTLEIAKNIKKHHEDPTIKLYQFGSHDTTTKRNTHNIPDVHEPTFGLATKRNALRIRNHRFKLTWTEDSLWIRNRRFEINIIALVCKGVHWFQFIRLSTELTNFGLHDAVQLNFWIISIFIFDSNWSLLFRFSTNQIKIYLNYFGFYIWFGSVCLILVWLKYLDIFIIIKCVCVCIEF